MKLQTVLLLALAVATASPAFAQTAYPTKPIRLINPFPPGGGASIIGRVIAQELTERLGNPWYSTIAAARAESSAWRSPHAPPRRLHAHHGYREHGDDTSATVESAVRSD